MAPKKKYKDAKFHYMGAYRLRIQELRPTWTAGQVAATLHWMFKYQATGAEREECIRLHGRASGDNLQVVDNAEIPDVPKESSNGPLAESGYGGGNAGEDGTPDEVPPKDRTITSMPQAEARINTSRFPYMPPLAQMSAQLPLVDEGKLDKALKRKLMEAGLCDTDREPEAKRWHGTHFLGQGATGSCTHWVKTDDNNNVQERLARDQPPREIAILRRLNEQRNYENNLHRYYGHRIDMWKRLYRVYNEVCDLGVLNYALQHYSRPWRRRHNRHRWLKPHPKIQEARNNPHGVLPEEVDDDVHTIRTEEWTRYLDAKAEDPENHKDGQFDDLSDIEDWNGEKVDDALPDVIPETFL